MEFSSLSRSFFLFSFVSLSLSLSLSLSRIHEPSLARSLTAVLFSPILQLGNRTWSIFDGDEEIESVESVWTEEGIFFFRAYTSGHSIDTSRCWAALFKVCVLWLCFLCFCFFVFVCLFFCLFFLFFVVFCFFFCFRSPSFCSLPPILKHAHTRTPHTHTHTQRGCWLGGTYHGSYAPEGTRRSAAFVCSTITLRQSTTAWIWCTATSCSRVPAVHHTMIQR